MRRLASYILALCATIMLISADKTPQQRYVDKYAELAVQEMYRSGVPASITLAQGLLESRYGLSALAAEGHNHFGIKCHKDWKGKTMKVDDDLKGECFRVYDEDIESFRDHSDFLRYRDRYKFLFDYDVKDYKAWAYGLSKAGYATDPNYPSKLIKLVEDYDLSRYDSAKPSDFKGSSQASKAKDETPINEKALYRKPQKKEEAAAAEPPARQTRAEKKAEKRAERKAKADRTREERDHKDQPAAPAEEVIPESPNALEEAELAPKSVGEEFHFSLARKIYTQNGVPFVYARESESYASLAEENHLFLKEILRFNDLESDAKLLPGTVVYLQAKKNQTRRGLDKYIVGQDGESLRDICQRFAVKQKNIMKLNGFAQGHELREGDTVLLRK